MYTAIISSRLRYCTVTKSIGTRGVMTNVSCSRCGKAGHARNNRRFHAMTEPLGKFASRKAYHKAHYREKVLGAQMRAECVICRQPHGRKRKDGTPLSRCQECQDAAEAGRSESLRLRKVYEDALEDIRCNSLEEYAVRTADAALQAATNKRKAA